MSYKLTLTIKNAELIEEVKAYAKANGRSVSSMVENYFKSFVDTNSEEKLSPKVASLLGSVPLPKEKEEDELLWEALQEKYLK